MEQSTKTLADYFDIVKRRKYYILVIWLLVSLVSIIVAYNLPKIYRSTATILIEAKIPSSLFSSVATQYADVQVQSIYQRVMTTDNVLAIIESKGLYKDLKEDYARSELAELFKDNTEIKLAKSTLISQAKSGLVEVAFDVSFSHNKAIIAKEITSKLAALFIEQSDSSRTQRVTKVTGFLKEESDKLSQDLQEIDNKIAEYKEQNHSSLPEQVQVNLATIDRTGQELRDTDSEIRTIKERIAFLVSAMARTDEDLPSRIGGNVPQSREKTIQNLMVEYRRLSSIYFPSHPSVVRLKRELKALDPDFEELSVEGDALKQLTEAKRELKKNTANPAYLALVSEYSSSKSELQALIDKKNYLKAKLEKIQDDLVLAPRVEMEYKDLLRKQEGIIKKYTQLKDKWLDSKIVKTLEEQQGASLTIIQKPIIPEQPEKAIRRKVAISGFFMGIIAGLGVAFFVEFIDPGIRGYMAISEVTGLMPLCVIPCIETPLELEERLVKQSQTKRIIVWIGLALTLLVAVAIFLFFFPLQTWAKFSA